MTKIELDEREMSALRTPKDPTGIGHAEIEAHATYDKDQIEFARTDKKQVLKVGFGPKTSAALSIECSHKRRGILVMCQCWGSAVLLWLHRKVHLCNCSSIFNLRSSTNGTGSFSLDQQVSWRPRRAKRIKFNLRSSSVAVRRS